MADSGGSPIPPDPDADQTFAKIVNGKCGHIAAVDISQRRNKRGHSSTRIPKLLDFRSKGNKSRNFHNMLMLNVLRHFTSPGAVKYVEFREQFVGNELRKQLTCDYEIDWGVWVYWVFLFRSGRL